MDKNWVSNGFFASAKSENDITEDPCIKPKIQESDIISLILLLKTHLFLTCFCPLFFNQISSKI